MVIKSLLLKSFRNYPELKVGFHPGFNFICGPNGAGKTNIIEAVSVLSNLRSFRGASDPDMVMQGSQSYYCAAEIGGARYSGFEVGYSETGSPVKRKMKIDGVEVSTAYEYYGSLLSVAFSPGDINLINGPAELRRRYFDSVISKFSPEYLNALRDYRKILGLRNALLKKYTEISEPDTRQLDVWDFMLAEKGSFIIKERTRFTPGFETLFRDNYARISGEEKVPELDYKNSSNCGNSEIYIKKLRSRLKQDTVFGYTGIGPHRDDYIFRDISGADFRARASQGQKRAASIAVKFSEKAIVEQKTEQRSILLIDDVFPEFDREKRHNLISLFDDRNQAFFTMADINIIDFFDKTDNRVFRVSEKGTVNEI